MDREMKIFQADLARQGQSKADFRLHANAVRNPIDPAEPLGVARLRLTVAQGRALRDEVIRPD